MMGGIDTLTYPELLERLKELEHYKDSTQGLWAIDRNPEEMSVEWIRKNAFRLGCRFLVIETSFRHGEIESEKKYPFMTKDEQEAFYKHKMDYYNCSSYAVVDSSENESVFESLESDKWGYSIEMKSI